MKKEIDDVTNLDSPAAGKNLVLKTSEKVENYNTNKLYVDYLYLPFRSRFYSLKEIKIFVFPKKLILSSEMHSDVVVQPNI